MNKTYLQYRADAAHKETCVNKHIYLYMYILVHQHKYTFIRVVHQMIYCRRTFWYCCTFVRVHARHWKNYSWAQLKMQICLTNHQNVVTLIFYLYTCMYICVYMNVIFVYADLNLSLNSSATAPNAKYGKIWYNKLLYFFLNWVNRITYILDKIDLYKFL